jgi:hypothetical protein
MCAECRLFVQTAFYVQGPSYPYSSECVEVEFCELRHNGVLRSSFSPRPRNVWEMVVL